MLVVVAHWIDDGRELRSAGYDGFRNTGNALSDGNMIDDQLFTLCLILRRTPRITTKSMGANYFARCTVSRMDLVTKRMLKVRTIDEGWIYLFGIRRIVFTFVSVCDA